MFKKQKSYNESDRNHFMISISDLMSAIFFIFFLLFLREYVENAKYRQAEKEIEDVYAKIEEELQKAVEGDEDVEIDTRKQELVLRDSVLFESSKWELKPVGQEKLRKVLPKFFSIFVDNNIKVNGKNIIEYLEQLTIEGHTDQSGPSDPNVNYLYNMDLSQKRAYEVANFIYTDPYLTESLGPERLKKLKVYLSSSGKSNSEPIYIDNNPNNGINKDKSRRVTIEYKIDVQKIRKNKKRRRVMKVETSFPTKSSRLISILENKEKELSKINTEDQFSNFLYNSRKKSNVRRLKQIFRNIEENNLFNLSTKYRNDIMIILDETEYEKKLNPSSFYKLFFYLYTPEERIELMRILSKFYDDNIDFHGYLKKYSETLFTIEGFPKKLVGEYPILREIILKMENEVELLFYTPWLLYLGKYFKISDLKSSTVKRKVLETLGRDASSNIFEKNLIHLLKIEQIEKKNKNIILLRLLNKNTIAYKLGEEKYYYSLTSKVQKEGLEKKLILTKREVLKEIINTEKLSKLSQIKLCIYAVREPFSLLLGILFSGIYIIGACSPLLFLNFPYVSFQMGLFTNIDIIPGLQKIIKIGGILFLISGVLSLISFLTRKKILMLVMTVLSIFCILINFVVFHKKISTTFKEAEEYTTYSSAWILLIIGTIGLLVTYFYYMKKKINKGEINE